MKPPLFEYDGEADEITVDFWSDTRRVELYVNANKVDSLRAEVEALKREAQHYKNIAFDAHDDADRYRFLCELNEKEPTKFYEFPDTCGWSKQEMDAEIDALRGEGEK